MKKVNFYIDGFNVYHPIDEYQKRKGICLKWLDYKSLCSSFLKEDEEIGTIYFFTAIRKDYKSTKPEKFRRHKVFIKALKNQGIEVVEGRFLRKVKRIYCEVGNCSNAKNPNFDNSFDLTFREEKRTDVNVACHLVRDAFLSERKEDTRGFDKAYIFSADTDLVPAIEIVRKYFDNKKLVIATLPSRWSERDNKFYFPKIEDLIKASSSKLLKLNFHRLKNHLLPKTLKTKAGKFINMPESYLSKEDLLGKDI
ncbi:MAG: NYN domain-containing protein [Candidatus Caenarcaniphilales bacterium]|nr:NYN domain-containing protein [Candidatus Caenarcaniphilales bacterium]